jgi:hypothetical protein
LFVLCVIPFLCWNMVFRRFFIELLFGEVPIFWLELYSFSSLAGLVHLALT